MGLEAYVVVVCFVFFLTGSFWITGAVVVPLLVISRLVIGKGVNYLASAENITNTPYRFPHFSAPRLSGIVLRIAVFLLENSGTLRTIFRSSNGLDKLDAYHIPDAPTTFPIHYPSAEEIGVEKASEQLINEILEQTQGALDKGDSPDSGFRYNTIKDYYTCYKTKKKTPLQVAENLIKALEESSRLRAIVEWDASLIREQARESTERFENNNPRSVLEGVPVSVKDQIHVRGLSTSKGRSYAELANEDSAVVLKLREAGAIIYGKANQTEMGIHVTGLNPNKRYGHCRNAYNDAHHTGGSSSGSGSAVAAGLGPISVAADGGGSIRIPASLCGQIGLKPTCGRVSLAGDTACYGSTVDVIGPITATAQDAAIVMSFISDRDPNDPLSIHSPPLSLYEMKKLSNSANSLQGIKIGIYDEWFEDAPEPIVSACREMVLQLEERGAEVIKIQIPELELMVPAHVLAITSEMHCDVHTDIRVNPSSFSNSTRILFALTGDNSAQDYIQSAKVRTRMITHFKRALEDVDVIITPANGTVAPPIPDLSDRQDESDVVKQDAIMRYMHGANLTGFPACVFPVSYYEGNLPISIQCIAGPWKEDLLLRIAALSHFMVKRSKPGVYYDLLA